MKTTLLSRAVFICAILCFMFSSQLANSQDKLINILDEEVQREIQTLKKQEIPAYYICYRVEENTGYSISSSFGTLTYSHENKSCRLTVTIRVGSSQLDNYHPVRGSSQNNFSSSIELPSSDEPQAVKQVLWNATNEAYQQAVSGFAKAKANVAVKVEEEDKSPDFTLEEAKNYIEPPIKPEDLKFDISSWENRIKKYSAAFLRDSAIFSGSGNCSYQISRKYFVSSEGDKIAQNSTFVRAGFSGTIKAKDGMEMPLYESYFAFKPEDLPTDEMMTKDINDLVINLVKLKTAPVAEPYSGPALLTGRAAGVFFHEIFGHRVEGQRMKNEDDAQTFKKKVDEQVLPAALSVYCDPQIKTYENMELSGSYVYDDQGSKGQRVDVVKDGILKDFLMSRTPINNFPKSNGHGRAMSGMQPAARQSNLIVETSQPKTNEELRAELIKLAKEQNKPYGYLFDDVVGGFTMTGRFIPNAFNVTPVLVYKVFTDGKPDEIVRGVDLVGTPLAIFSQIDQAGGKVETFNGYCGAESGSVPVACVAPVVVLKLIETQKKSKSQERPIVLPRPDSK
ncbi:MAG: TldD/PmbA family protein [Bacteroidia bacterium]|nr:TldD/PmbA family protein [Bacteroidia bacterium]